MDIAEFKKFRLDELAEREVQETMRRNYKKARALPNDQLYDLVFLTYLGRGDYGLADYDFTMHKLIHTAEPLDEIARAITHKRPFLEYLKDGVEIAKDDPRFKDSIALFKEKFLDVIGRYEFFGYSLDELSEITMPEYMIINRNKAKALPPEKLYDLVFLMYLGRGDHDLENYELEIQGLKDDSPADEWARHITEKKPFEEYLERGMRIAKDDPRLADSIALFLNTFAVELEDEQVT